MKIKFVIIALLVAITALGVERIVNRTGTGLSIAPPSSLRTANVRDVVAYSKMAATTYRVRSTRDILPGGYSLAMAPILIDWDLTDIPGGDIVVRNVNHGGNPVSGITVLRSARIRLHKVKIIFGEPLEPSTEADSYGKDTERLKAAVAELVNS